MKLVLDVIVVFGWVSLLLLVLGLWAHLDMRKQKLRDEAGKEAKSK